MSKLQQLDSDLTSIENTIHQQNNELVEKDAVIQNNKSNIEFLNKKIKVHEEKVKDRITYTFCRLVVRRCDGPFLFSSLWRFQIHVLQKINKLCEDDRISLQQELQTKEQRLQQQLTDRRRVEQRVHGMMEDTKLKWERECVSQACRIIRLTRV